MMRRSLVGVMCALLAGCGGDGGEARRVGPTPEAFCASLAAEACAGHERCCGAPEEIDPECVDHVTSYCMEWPDFLQYEAGALERSHVECRPDLAQALLEEAKAAFATCEPYRVPLGAAFFAPRLSEGSRCLDSSGCPGETRCYTRNGEEGICRKPPDEVGAGCDVLGGSGTCADGLVCNFDDVCIEPLALGAACESFEHCASLVCAAGKCAACVVSGDSCTSEECALWCPGDRVCEAEACNLPVPASREVGESCEFAVQCTSYVCGSGNVCLPEDSSGSLDPYCLPERLVPPLWT